MSACSWDWHVPFAFSPVRSLYEPVCKAVVLERGVATANGFQRQLRSFL